MTPYDYATISKQNEIISAIDALNQNIVTYNEHFITFVSCLIFTVILFFVVYFLHNTMR